MANDWNLKAEQTIKITSIYYENTNTLRPYKFTLFFKNIHFQIYPLFYLLGLSLPTV